MRNYVTMLAGMAAIWSATALAQLAPAVEAPLPNKEEFKALSDRMAAGDALTEDEMTEARKGFAALMIRPEHLDLGQNAQYEVAEIRLSHGKALEAVARLREVAAAQQKPDETAWVTRFNTAEILRVALNETEEAAKEFQQVNGNLQPLAQREMFDMLERDAKKFDLAVTTIEKAAAETKDKGARWALLTRLGNLYRRTKNDDKAAEIFQRIAQEATPDAVEALRRQAAAEVASAAKQIMRLHASDHDEEADNLQRELARRCNALRIQGRQDEAAAMQSALDKLDADLKQLHPAAD